MAWMVLISHTETLGGAYTQTNPTLTESDKTLVLTLWKGGTPSPFSQFESSPYNLVSLATD